MWNPGGVKFQQVSPQRVHVRMMSVRSRGRQTQSGSRSRVAVIANPPFFFISQNVGNLGRADCQLRSRSSRQPDSEISFEFLTQNPRARIRLSIWHLAPPGHRPCQIKNGSFDDAPRDDRSSDRLSDRRGIVQFVFKAGLRRLVRTPIKCKAEN